MSDKDRPDKNHQDKYQSLIRDLGSFKRLAIAFSGGADSSFLGAAAKEACDDVLAVTVRSEFQTRTDADLALRMAQVLGLEHILLETRVLEDPNIKANPRERCYFCKKHLFAMVKARAGEAGFSHLAHGANLDDLKDFRPGFKAAREAGFLAPLIDAGLTKNEIRNYSRDLGLETWNLPSQSCLAARIPYGDPITREKLIRIETAESILHALGFLSVRVRCHGDLARIELPPGEMDRFTAGGHGREIARQFREIGFHFTSLDLEGYTTGSLNRSPKA
ncbi:ATP-dependent sacrificial sulfur transferase LarE [Desulfospira joergensenii]|uniref:ATP-dependent sacrificial sulfur transferase LarE n=1 Tax=Desulfospira joergensenii TaxID=53329 RepID=UPI0003B3523A|nr:ATP-dependent sacrificial sulfur transferase LarE [Desulfospira joergensenii]